MIENTRNTSHINLDFGNKFIILTRNEDCRLENLVNGVREGKKVT